MNGMYEQEEMSSKDRFIPPRGLSNNHLQTLLPRLLRRKPLFEPVWHSLETDDGDFLDLAWSEEWQTEVVKKKKICIIFHGLEGGFASPYANGLMHAFARKGWLAVLMHFRGCSGRPNRLARSYHSGETGDARLFLEFLAKTFPGQQKVAVGFSLGGNMLARYLAAHADEPLLDEAVIVSAPFDLAACTDRIEQGFSRVYSRYLLSSLKRRSVEKLPLLHSVLGISTRDIQALTSLRGFDDLITAPLHGFRDASDYYARCSALPILPHISIPTQIIHAKDDPFMTEAVIPDSTLPSHMQYHLLDHGGHVGFLYGSRLKPRFWLEDYLPHYYAD